jgi:hypothetical protein
MSQFAPPPVPDTITHIMTAPLLSRALYAVVEIGVPDQLADGPRSIDELAAHCGVLQGILRTMLRSVTMTGLLSTEADGRIALTDTGRSLLTEHPSAAGDLVRTLGGRIYHDGLGEIVEHLRTGCTGVELTTGYDIFEHLANHPDEAAGFNRAMIAYHGSEPAAIVAACDFTGDIDVIDIGGGIGILLATILEANPDAVGTLLDLPHVISDARRQLAPTGLGERCTFLAGNFFDHIPAGRDIYLMSHILHDWDDQTCISLLRRVAEAMKPDARLLVIEAVLPDGDEPHPAKLLNVLISTLHGGCERTEAEFAALLDCAGLELTTVVPANPMVAVVHARRRRTAPSRRR